MVVFGPSTAVTLGGSEPSEWWQRLSDRGAIWAGRHPVAVGRLRTARTVWLWGSLVWVLGLLIAVPDVRGSAWVYVQVYWLLLVWFALTPTRTVRWGGFARMLSLSMVWALVIGALLRVLATHDRVIVVAGLSLPGRVRDLGPSVALAGLGEESLKLAPLAILALVAPRRVRRFSVTDWLLMGLASGLGFEALEEILRAALTSGRRPGLLEVLLGADSSAGVYGWSPLSGSSPAGGWDGHHVTTALVSVTVGLTLAAWRRLRTPWRAAVLAAPLLMWWLMVSLHAGHNATLATQDQWLTGPDRSVPTPLRLGWSVMDAGISPRWLLVLLLLVALLVDARHLMAVDDLVLAVPWSAAARARSWAGRLQGPAGSGLPRAGNAFVLAGCALVAYVWRDKLVALAAHGFGEQRSWPTQLARGRAGLEMTRRAREEALRIQAGPAVRVRDWRAVAIIALGLLGLAGTWLAYRWSVRIGDSPQLVEAARPWLAGLLGDLGEWWAQRSPAEQMAIGFGLAGLIALSGGSLGVAFGASGAATYLASHGRGAGTFVTDPRAATIAYLRTSTPGGLLADSADFALTFVPASFGGAAAGRTVRGAVDEYARNPEAFIAARRLGLRGDAGNLDPAAFAGVTRGGDDFSFQIGHRASGSGLAAQLDEKGNFTFAIENFPQDGSVLRGKQMFDEALAHFGDRVQAVQGAWVFGDNLARFNHAVDGGASLVAAAKQTWTGQQAARHGFTRVRIDEAIPLTDGGFRKVYVTFRRGR